VSRRALRGNGVRRQTRKLGHATTAYAGLPTITYVTDSDGQVTEVTVAGKRIISYDWTA
jgi:hypothetical protein